MRQDTHYFNLSVCVRACILQISFLTDYFPFLCNYILLLSLLILVKPQRQEENYNLLEALSFLTGKDKPFSKQIMQQFFLPLIFLCISILPTHLEKQMRGCKFVFGRHGASICLSFVS